MTSTRKSRFLTCCPHASTWDWIQFPLWISTCPRHEMHTIILKPGLSRPIFTNLCFLGFLKNLKIWKARFLSFWFSGQNFYFFYVKLWKFIELIGVPILFHNVKHISALVRLIFMGLLLDRIPVSSIPRATVRTLKPKKPKNLNLF